MHTTDILILGAGIGGYETFRSLTKQLRRAGINKRITIVDKHNYFTFVPMLHEVATGSIEPTHCAIPLREIVYRTPHTFLKASVLHIDPAKKTVNTSAGVITFQDACIIALGSTTNYFDIPGAETQSYHVRSLVGAMELKHDFLHRLEDTAAQTIAINVVGGGYTGVEVVGQFCDLAHKDLKKLYPEKQLSLRLVHAGDTILPYMSSRVQQRVQQRLSSHGVDIRTKALVTQVTPTSILLSDGTSFHSDMTIWTAGFQTIAPSFLDTGYNAQGRIDVTPTLTIPAWPYMYAVGDISHSIDPRTNIAYPQLAEAAHLQGEYVAKHLTRSLQQKKTRPFVFKSKGQLMPVGDWWGVAEIGPFTLFGKFAWWIRRTVYVLFMPGFLRKLRIVFDWTIHSFGFRDVINVTGAAPKKE